MLTLNDGRTELWQWDTGRTLSVDADCSQVHFSNKVFGRSIDVDVVDGVAIIPDILLQTDKDLNVWAFVGTAENGYTKISKTFKVNRRNKPADYVFTPTEQTTLQELVERLDAIEESQDPDAIKNAVEDYLEQNTVEVPVESVNGQTGKVDLTAKDVGAISQDDLQDATNEALAQAKASGEFDGKNGENGEDGYTPVKGIDYFDGEPGKDGNDGEPGADGQDGKSAYQIAIENGFEGSEKEWLESLKGEQGEPGENGSDGLPGLNGDDGESVTIVSITESTESGGTNTVEFSDGNKLEIKNGQKGDKGDQGDIGPQGEKGETGVKGDTGATGATGATGPAGAAGYTPIKGVDYYTDAEKAEFSEYIATELAKRGQLKPEFANSVEECTDTTKLYVLPDGYIYAYLHEGGYTNLVPTSIDSDGSVFNSNGYQDGYSLDYSTSGTSLVIQSGFTSTGFIPFTYTDIVRMSGVTWGSSNKSCITFYDENKKPLCCYLGNGYLTLAQPAYTDYSVPVQCLADKSLQSVTTENGVATFNLVFQTKDTEDNGINTTITRAGPHVKYIRISAVGNGADMVITLNEEIEGEAEGGYAWRSTGHAFVPADYEDRIVALEKETEENATAIEELQQEVADIIDGNTSIAAMAKFDPTIYDLPVLYLEGDVSPIKVSKDNKVDMTYAYGDYSGSCTLKGQGATSYKTAQALGDRGKFNYTIKLDQAIEVVSGWGAQKKYCLKANFIDHTHSRNIISCKLWGEMVKSRSTVPTELAGLPNGGAIDGFPIVIMLNGEFHGLYTWNIPKDGWMFGLEEDTTKTQAIVCANQHSTATQFKGELAGDESDFELEFVSDEDNADWVTTSLNTLINACINSDGTDLDTTVAQYIDWDSAIDYYIHAVVERADDGVDKNFLLTTFDGTKWYFTDYDRDTIYGLAWDGSSLARPVADISFASCATTSRMWQLIKLYKTDQLKSRYKTLRANVLSESRIMQTFENFAWAIPFPVKLEDVKRWPSVPGTSVNTIDQIGRWLRQRLETVDAWLEAL